MKIGLIDLDHKPGGFPNLVQMKISGWYKSQGADVDWYNPMDGHYDAVYMSKVFSFTQNYRQPIDADVVYFGGSGYQIQMKDGKEHFNANAPFDLAHPQRLWQWNYRFMDELPQEIEHCYPDYDLYPDIKKDTAYGFLTRGCPRGCGFCIVAGKEGTRSHKVADLSEFWHGQKNIVLCDPNLLACKDAKDLLQQLIDSKARIDINQGIDARMLTEETALMLAKMRMDDWHFAWDQYNQKDVVLRGLKLFRDAMDEAKRNWSPHHYIVFVLVNYNTTKEEDLDRIYSIRSLGYYPYVMVYDKSNCRDRFYKDLQRWVNNRFIFAKNATLEEYLKNK